jgi:hypothetical protein
MILTGFARLQLFPTSSTLATSLQPLLLQCLEDLLGKGTTGGGVLASEQKPIDNDLELAFRQSSNEARLIDLEASKGLSALVYFPPRLMIRSSVENGTSYV